MRPTPSPAAILTSLALMLALYLPSTGEAKDGKNVSSWELKYRSGSLQLKKNQWLKGGFLSRAQNRAAALVITREQLNAIYFNAKARKDSAVMQKMPRSGCYRSHYSIPKDGSNPEPEIFALWIASPRHLERAAERLDSRFPVRFVWTDNGVRNEVVFTLDYCDYASFLANAQRFAGDRWRDISREFQR